jgi:hypothetical protein
MVDSENPTAAGPKCQVSEIVYAFELEGRQCPYCKKGPYGEILISIVYCDGA